jgi:hypothetical protein
MPDSRAGASHLRGERGQALLLLVGVLCAIVVGAGVIAAIAAGIGRDGEQQRAADLAALAGARAMREAYGRLFEPPVIGDVINPRHLERAAYLELGRRAAAETARRNGARRVAIEVPDAAQPAPVRIRVTVRDPIDVAGVHVPARASATAELVPAIAALAPVLSGSAGEYPGPFAQRQGKPMRPDVAMAFDRLAAAARADGVGLVIASAFRSDAEQAQLFAAHPDPKWVARPGTSLHRLGTELDLGPKSAYGWLAGNAPRFGFRQRYAWEPWHWGLVANAGSASVGWRSRGPSRGDGASGSTLPAFVPDRFAPHIAHAAMRWNISGALLAAQLMQESGFNPFARSAAGAQGIAQFMPGTARAYGLRDPFDAAASIDAQAHLMHDLLRQFASVPLALAAYNAGPARVAACGCVPSIPETVSYVAAILGMLTGAGDPSAGGGGLEVRLVS